MSEVGGPQAGVILGEEAKPPFAVLPDPSCLFLTRAQRLVALAPHHDLADGRGRPEARWTTPVPDGLLSKGGP
jgi:hypothetical protein